MHYAEVELQIQEDVLRTKLDDGTKKYYNGHIAAVKFIPPSEHSIETKSKISIKLRERYKDRANHWINRMSDDEKEQFSIKYLRGDNHPTKRTRSAEEYQVWIDNNLRGENNPMYGKTHSTITKKKLSEKANKRNPECYSTATDTKIQRGLAIPKEKKSEWELYREQVFNYTYKSWRHHQHKINPGGLHRGAEYELDHKFSITEGFKQNVDPKVIGHYTNLELLPKYVNRSKRIKCSITLEDLLQLVKS